MLAYSTFQKHLITFISDPQLWLPLGVQACACFILLVLQALQNELNS